MTLHALQPTISHPEQTWQEVGLPILASLLSAVLLFWRYRLLPDYERVGIDQNRFARSEGSRQGR